MSYESALAELKSIGIEVNKKEETNGLNNDALIREIEIINRIERAYGMPLSDEQRQILMCHDNMAIIACAGSGKTTTLVMLIAKRILSGEIADVRKLMCASYSRTSREDLEKRVNEMLTKLGVSVKVEVKTLHALFLFLIRQCNIRNEVISEGTRLGYISQAAREADFELRDTMLADLNNMLSYQVNNIMSDKDTVDSQVNTIEIDLSTYSMIRKRYAELKSINSQIDFDDMQMYLYTWLVYYKNSGRPEDAVMRQQIINYCKFMWEYFYIDEAQDVSKIQFRILKEILAFEDRPNILDKKLVFIGDDDQSIYKWRGADPTIILNICNIFNMQLKMLGTNYRCKSNIVDYAVACVNHNANRYTKSIKAFNDGGEIILAVSEKKNILSLSDIAMDRIETLLKNGVSANEICIMSRNNAHLALMNNMLLHKGIYCTCTEEMKLSKQSMYKDVKLMIELAEDSWDKNIMKSLVPKLCRYLGTAKGAMMSKVQEVLCTCSSDTLGIMLKESEMRSDIEIMTKAVIPETEKKKLRNLWYGIGEQAKEDLYTIYKLIKNKDKGVALNGLMTLYLSGLGGVMYKSQDKRRCLVGLFNYVNKLEKEMGIAKLKEFFRITEQYETGSFAVPGKKITLSTIHSAKGKEWKHVISFACDSVSMPNLESINSMLDTSTSQDIDDYIDEERRLYYVETTRAKDSILQITTTEPSVFILESLGYYNNIPVGNSEVISEACKYASEGTMSKGVKQFIKDLMDKGYDKEGLDKVKFINIK